MTSQRLEAIISQFHTKRIAVIGDFFLDKYLDVDTSLEEKSLETEKKAHQVVCLRHSPGAAGNVVKNLAALGTGSMFAFGITGEDGEGYELRSDLKKLECNTDALLSSQDMVTPTYLKPRDINNPGLQGEHERYDVKNRRPVPRPLVSKLIDSLDTILPDVDGVIIVDQMFDPENGVISKVIRETLSNCAARFSNTIFLADSRSHIRQFRNIMLKPNQFETMGIASPKPGDEIAYDMLAEQVKHIRSEADAPMFVTCGARGILITDPSIQIIPAVRLKDPIDTTGAGDTVSAALVLSLVSGASPVEAALIGNLAASITAQQLATTGTAQPDELTARFEMWIRQQAQRQKEKTVQNSKFKA
ncbi:MAG: carbohydrate kinase [Candidatus Latescibacteria bacterium]|nr:carbohydrate kinase [Candidatus Latescibacterota bacterium]